MGMNTFSMSAWQSPRHLISLANAGSLLSFDDSRASTHHAGNGAPLMRLIAGISLSRSKSSTDMEDSTHQTSEGDNPDADIPHPEAVVTLNSNEIEMEHPLSSIIPPMIVIDDIDDNQVLHSKTIVDHKSPQVPGKIIKASTALISALRNTKGSNMHGIL